MACMLQVGWSSQPTRMVVLERCAVPAVNLLGSEGQVQCVYQRPSPPPPHPPKLSVVLVVYKVLSPSWGGEGGFPSSIRFFLGYTFASENN